MNDRNHTTRATRDSSAASFRDPGGRLLTVNGRIVRIINESAVPELRAFLASKTARQFVSMNRLVRTTVLDTTEIQNLIRSDELKKLLSVADPGMVVEHERVSFPSFPYEWPPQMLYEAACFTLDLVEELLTEGFGLKDATPYNILFNGPNPVFVDLLSFELRDATDPIWLPYSQFVRTFLLPLFVNKYLGIPLDQIFTTRRDGLEPEEVYRLCGPLRKLMPPFLTLVSLPTWLSARHDQDDMSIYQKKSLDNPEKAQFILNSLFKRLRRVLKGAAPESKKWSIWSNYLVSNNNYSQENFAMKRDFVEEAITEFSPTRVLDIGCNTGYFSAIAAKSGASVVAIDYDPVVVSNVWHNARAEGLNILPLTVNLTRPTPSVGWRNRESPSFLDRAHGAFDAVLMLAVIHHMLVSERIPLPEIIDLAAELTTDLCVIEFIAPNDSMFRRIARGRDDLFNTLTTESFEETCRRHFKIIRVQRLKEANRWLYLLRKERLMNASA